MALPIASTSVDRRAATAAWTLTVAVVLVSIVCLVLPRTPATALWRDGLTVLLVIGASIVLFANLAAHRRRVGPMVLARPQAAFVLGPSRLYHARSIVYGFAWIAYISATPILLPEQPWVALRVALIVLFAIVIVVEGLILPSRRPRVELHPGGLRLFWPLSHRDIPWESLGPTGPPRSYGWPAPARIRLNVVQPDVVSTGGPGWHRPRRIGLPFPIVFPPVDVAALIDHYIAHPEFRGGIGSPDELDRLRATGLA